jgi:predicted restriction endonuclease
MKEAGYHPNKIYRAKYERYMSLDHHKRKVAAAIDASSCWICGEDRAVDLAHIAPKAEDYPLVPENALALCPTHHRLYDYGLLRKEEVEKIMPKLKEGAQCGFNSQHYRVTTLSLVSAG